ncbi:Cellular tumor antigen p53 [Amphibalanus amphitrite]|uniref:Cellular tumor antigen p53 n=1 Tax=Amphibalanus amphitrite TaxID=1232801 RepID=A0A6A4W9U6_AMPAM|nr:Cellular tumor antigen p53 [Amphibalanus amphitrite]
MTSSLDSSLLLFSPDDEVLEQVKVDIGFQNLSQDWDSYMDPVEHPLKEHQLSELEPAPAEAKEEPAPPAQKQVSVQPVANSVPVLDGWPGVHQFQVTVRRRPEQAGRQLPYVYSADGAKLYTDMMVAVPFSFTYSGVADPSALRIRALPIYRESHHIQTPVRRCAIHREPQDPSNDTGHMMHVVRADHHHASYHVEQERCSVTVPLEAPEPGTDHYQVLFKFACMNTCVGGINRRRLMLVLTLEERASGRTLGRQAVEVKVCRCPHRDWRADEKRKGSEQAQPKASKRPRREPSPPPPSNGQQQLYVVADDPAMYRYLVEARESLLRYRRSVLAEQAPPAPLSRQDTAPVKPEYR